MNGTKGDNSGCSYDAGGGGGGSYGGLGGEPSGGSGCNPDYATTVYGIQNGFVDDMKKGSGGGGGNSYTKTDGTSNNGCCNINGGKGGGSLALIAKNSIIIKSSAKIIMNGTKGDNSGCSYDAGGGGGGSGGEILLAAKTIDMSESLANVILSSGGGKGGKGTNCGGDNNDPGDEGGSGGGGGRVKIVYSNGIVTSAANILVNGGDGYTNNYCGGLGGTDGTVFIDQCSTISCIPTTETCNGLDDDCDDAIDEDLTTTDGCNQAGYCAGSYKTCSFGSWGECNRLPQTEICSNSIDDDCDGQVDEADCTASCISVKEECDGLDNDCDGIKDDENVCCDFSQLYWKIPPKCIDDSIGQGANITLFVKGNSKCYFGNYGDTIGVFRPTNGVFYLRNTNSQGNADITATFGTNGDIPIAGDWNNDGIDTIGVYRPSEKRFFLSNSNAQIGNAPSFVYSIAMTGDIPIAGDWNNDGIDTIGVYRPGTSTFFLRNSNSDGSADITPFAFGINGDMPIIGDWNNDGIDSVGLFRPIEGKFFLRNTNSQGNADITATFGTDGDLPIAGDWNNDGIDSVGVFRPTNGMFYLRNTNSAGPADASFAFGTKGDLPIAGDIDGSKKSGNHYVIISVKEKDVISNDDDVSKEPLPNRIWFGLNGNITSNWITEYQDDESGTDPEYYIIAEFGNLNNANKKDTRTSTMKVKACNRIKDGDCDGVKNEIDECPSSDECAVVNSNGCEEDTGEAKCQAFWDCSMVAWSDCNENNQQKRDLCKSGSGDCCGTWPLANCACSFTGDQENFNSCKDYFTPLTEKSCFTEEAFPAFTLSNFIITILLITGFYALRKKRY